MRACATQRGMCSDRPDGPYGKARQIGRHQAQASPLAEWNRWMRCEPHEALVFHLMVVVAAAAAVGRVAGYRHSFDIDQKDFHVEIGVGKNTVKCTNSWNRSRMSPCFGLMRRLMIRPPLESCFTRCLRTTIGFTTSTR